jgi:hypothetical protein
MTTMAGIINGIINERLLELKKTSEPQKAYCIEYIRYYVIKKE